MEPRYSALGEVRVQIPRECEKTKTKKRKKTKERFGNNKLRDLGTIVSAEVEGKEET